MVSIPKPALTALSTIKALKKIKKYHRQYIEAKKNGEEIDERELALKVVKSAKLPSDNKVVDAIAKAITGDIDGLKALLNDLLPEDAKDMVFEMIELIADVFEEE